MKEKLMLWYECDFKLFTWSILQIMLKRFSSRELAEIYARQVKLVHWEDRIEMKTALQKQDMERVQEIAENSEVEDYVDTDLYKHFLWKVLLYELFYLFLGISLLVFIVLIIEGR